MNKEEKQVLKFILSVLVTKEKDQRRKTQLVLDSLVASQEKKEKYKAEHDKYLIAIAYISNLL